DATRIGFADYSGNRQYMSTGNLSKDNRVSLFFMDYPNRRRLKMFGRVELVGLEQEDILAQLEDSSYPAMVERGVVITIEGFDWNCPAHITPRYTEADIATMNPGAGEITVTEPVATAVVDEVLGEGPLALEIVAMRQLTPQVRAYELRDPTGKALPAVTAGAHLRVPVPMADGSVSERHYSIASDPKQRDYYEIAVLRDEEGSGGSRALHLSYHLGMRLQVDPPANHFGLHDDKRPAVLLAGGIGITPMKAMAYALDHSETDLQLHYAGSSRGNMAFLDSLHTKLENRLMTYSKARGQRLDFDQILRAAPEDAIFYACGPARFISGLFEAARALGISRQRLCVELFH
ncbi:MAG: pyridoxamine 5'-phosphate oxidase, partial [Halieaceae bacterium]|nr:pyridoxamine 5'-phosphate oxidase [Halieaceae bacterium]